MASAGREAGKRKGTLFPTKTNKKGKVTVTPISYASSTPAQSGMWQVCEDSEVVSGDTVAYFLDMENSPDWFVGVVQKIYKSFWADILYSDGQLCNKWLISERGFRWVKLVPASSSPTW